MKTLLSVRIPRLEDVSNEDVNTCSSIVKYLHENNEALSEAVNECEKQIILNKIRILKERSAEIVKRLYCGSDK